MEINREELAWAAGFYDGEGYVGISRGRQIGVNITQVHPAVLERLRDAVKLGKLYGPYTRKKVTYSPCWYYQIYGFERVQYFFCLLWPWLSPEKKIQAKAALLRARGV